MSDARAAFKRTSIEYQVRWQDGGWLVAHVSEATGVLSICSDCGAWGYRWSLDGMPDWAPTLNQFLAKQQESGFIEYLARKLIPRERQQVLDLAASRRRIRQDICERRRQRLISAENARSLWHSVADWDGEARLANWWEGVYAPSSEWLTLTKRVLPALLETIRGFSEGD